MLWRRRAISAHSHEKGDMDSLDKTDFKPIMARKAMNRFLEGREGKIKEKNSVKKRWTI